MDCPRKSARIITDPGAAVVLTNRPDRYLRDGGFTVADGWLRDNHAARSITWLGFYPQVVYRTVNRLLEKFYPQDIVAAVRSQNRSQKLRKGAGHPATA